MFALRWDDGSTFGNRKVWLRGGPGNDLFLLGGPFGPMRLGTLIVG